jgi:hypothetical protein
VPPEQFAGFWFVIEAFAQIFLRRQRQWSAHWSLRPGSMCHPL